MQKQKFDEIISYVNKKVSEMEIETKYKMELLGMVTALGYAHEKETHDKRTETHACDCIDRQAAIDAIEKMNIPEDMCVFEILSHIEVEIATLPPAQPEQRWIPVSEKLPDELAEVNVTWENTEPEPYYDFVKGHCFSGTAVYFRGRWYWYSAVCVDYLGEYGFSPNDEMDDAIKVLAWMPLPEPYKQEAEE